MAETEELTRGERFLRMASMEVGNSPSGAEVVERRRRFRKHRAFWRRRQFWIVCFAVAVAIFLVLWLISNMGVVHGEVD
jgi:hypothetical protein